MLMALLALLNIEGVCPLHAFSHDLSIAQDLTVHDRYCLKKMFNVVLSHH